MTRADLVVALAGTLIYPVQSGPGANVVAPGVLILPGARTPGTVCGWFTEAQVMLVAGRLDAVGTFDTYDALVDDVLDALGDLLPAVRVVGDVPAPAVEALGAVDHLTSTLTVQFA